MFFTREDIEKIHQGLLRLGIKDSELPETINVNSDDTLAVVQDGKNKKINIEEFFNNISLFKKEGFINITDRFNKHSISLIEAIQTVPTHQRIDGLVITFEDINRDWRIYQFRGNAVDFFDENKWTDLYDYTNYIVKSITPDEEDLTVSKPDKNGNAIVSLKDKVYDESNFSGKGYKILRKNIQTIDGVRKNILTQDMINKPNTIYEIRYDFDLNGDEVQIKEGCMLYFIGGSLSNGSIRLNDCILHNERFINIKLNDVYNRQLNLARLYNKKNTKEVNQSIFKNCTTLYIPNGEYEFNYSIELDENSSLVEMFGDSAIKPVLKFNSCNGIIVKKHIKLHDIKIYGINCSGVYDANEMMFKGGFYGIDIQSGCKMYNLDIGNFLIGMNIVQGHVIDAEFSSIILQYNSNAGMYILHDNNNQKNNCSFSHLYCVKNGYNVDNLTSNSTQRNCGFGLFIHGGYCNSFQNNVFEYNSGVGLYIKEPITNSPFIGCSFINNYFERNKYANFIIQLISNIHLCRDLLVKSNYFTEAGYDIVPDADIRRRVILEDRGIRSVSRSSVSENNIDIETFNFNYIGYDKMYNSISVGVPLIKDELDKKYYFKFTKETPFLSYFDLFNDILEIGLYYLVITAKLGENTGNKLAIFTIPNVKYLPTSTSITLRVDSTEEKTTYLPIYVDSFKQILRSLNIYFNEGLQDGESVFMNIELIKATSCTTEQLEYVTYLPVGYSIYNSTIEKIVTWDGSKWVSDNGIYKDKGSTSERPTLTSTDEGCEYYDSTLKKKILWNGTEWTNMDGTTL